MDFPENACIVPGKTEEVVLPGESTQTSDTAGKTTSSDPALRPAHLPLNRSLRSLGKAFGRVIPVLPISPDKSEFKLPTPKGEEKRDRARERDEKSSMRPKDLV